MNKITVKFLTTKANVAGFNDGVLLVNAYYNDTLDKLITQLNDYRSPDSQITTLFTTEHKPVHKSLWNVKLTNSMSFYID